jgi:serine/threonine protein kinase
VYAQPAKGKAKAKAKARADSTPKIKGKSGGKGKGKSRGRESDDGSVSSLGTSLDGTSPLLKTARERALAKVITRTETLARMRISALEAALADARSSAGAKGSAKRRKGRGRAESHHSNKSEEEEEEEKEESEEESNCSDDGTGHASDTDDDDAPSVRRSQEYGDMPEDSQDEDSEEEDEDEDDLGEWEDIVDDDEYFMPRCADDWTVGNYRIMERLQWGGFGSVFKVRHVVSRVPFAMKVYRVETEENVEREHKLLMSIRHENVMAISMLRAFCAPSNGVEYQYAVMPLYPKDLAQFIYAAAPSDAEIHSIMVQVCGGLGAIHATNHVHADLKPENILVDDVAVPGKIRACICDFGSVLDLGTGGPYDEFGHTLMLSPPELVCACDALVGFGLDVFALGCIYTELCTEQSLFNEKKEPMAHLGLVADLDRSHTFPDAVKAHRTFFNRRGHLRDNMEAAQAGKMDTFFAHNPLDGAQREFIRQCCRLDPTARPAIDQLVTWLDTYYAGKAANNAAAAQTAPTSLPDSAAGGAEVDKTADLDKTALPAELD